jgi:hypothetical protein
MYVWMITCCIHRGIQERVKKTNSRKEQVDDDRREHDSESVELQYVYVLASTQSAAGAKPHTSEPANDAAASASGSWAREARWERWPSMTRTGVD